MKAAFYDGQKTIRIGESDAMKPGPDDVQIQVAYCGICGTDLHIYAGHMDARVAKPHVAGHEMSGSVIAVGSNVSRWKTGQRVVVRPLDPCGTCPACRAGHSHICQKLKFLGIDTPGAFQGVWTVPAHTLHALPENVDFTLGALIEPLAVACHDVRLGEVRPGDYAVILGAGPIGMLIALVARAAGAQVLLSEINPQRLALARELGFDVVNPLELDLPAFVVEKTGGAGADVVFEVSGSQAGATAMTQLARTRGRIVVVAIYSQQPNIDLFRFFWRELRLCGARVYEPEDFEKALQLASEKSLPLERLITACRPLDDLAAVFEELGSGGAGMKTLIEIGNLR